MSKFKHRVPYSPSQKLNQLSDIPTDMEIGEPPSPIEAVSPIFKGDRWVFPTTSTDTDENLNLGKISPPNFASTPKKDMLNSSIDSDKTEIYTYDFEQGNITPVELINVEEISTPGTGSDSVQIIGESQNSSPDPVNDQVSRKGKKRRILPSPARKQGTAEEPDRVDEILNQLKQTCGKRRKFFPSPTHSKYTIYFSLSHFI